MDQFEFIQELGEKLINSLDDLSSDYDFMEQVYNKEISLDELLGIAGQKCESLFEEGFEMDYEE